MTEYLGDVECTNISNSNISNSNSIVTSDDQMVSEPQAENTHCGNGGTSLARTAIGEMKECISERTSTPSSSQAESTFGGSCFNAFTEKIQRWLELFILTELKQTKRIIGALLSLQLRKISCLKCLKNLYSLVHSGRGENRLILWDAICSLMILQMLTYGLNTKRLKLFQESFSGLYDTLNFGHWINPVGLYCLLTNETQKTYERLLTELLSLVPLANSQKLSRIQEANLE